VVDLGPVFQSPSSQIDSISTVDRVKFTHAHGDSDSHSRAGDREAIQHLVDLGCALQSHSPIDSISTK
jgi:hypothetical protein